jgi:hypothetical protein
MTQRTRRSTKFMIHSMMAAALITVAACNSTPSSKSAPAASDSEGARVDVLCIGDRISNPPEPFHYSYKHEDASGSTEKEADITPQTMDITIRDESGSHQYHGVRSDEASWNRAVLDLSNLQITRMSSVLVTLNDSSAIVQHGSESMNGYDATKFSIDTANASSSDRRKFETLFGNGSFEKGTVWAPPDGCAVKLVLDEAVQVGGSLNKAHYEINRIKK